MLETRTLPQAATASTATLWRYQHPDPLRSVRLETDTNAALITAEEYRPYGSSAYRSALTSTQPPKRYRFNGQEADEETGLNHHQHRYYAPWLSRWIRPDPAGLVDGPNRYWFARDNPIANGDDSGLRAPARNCHFMMSSLTPRSTLAARPMPWMRRAPKRPMATVTSTGSCCKPADRVKRLILHVTTCSVRGRFTPRPDLTWPQKLQATSRKSTGLPNQALHARRRRAITPIQPRTLLLQAHMIAPARPRRRRPPRPLPRLLAP